MEDDKIDNEKRDYLFSLRIKTLNDHILSNPMSLSTLQLSLSFSYY